MSRRSAPTQADANANSLPAGGRPENIPDTSGVIRAPGRKAAPRPAQPARTGSPVIHPRHGPKAAQTLCQPPTARAACAALQAKASQPAPAKTRPAVPHVYRPNPVQKVLQAKPNNKPGAPPASPTPPKRPAAPPVYKPKAAGKAAQPKAAGVKPRPTPGAPAVYRPQPAPRVLQAKMSAHAAAAQSPARQAHGDAGQAARGEAIQPHMITGGAVSPGRMFASGRSDPSRFPIQLMRPLPNVRPTISDIDYIASGRERDTTGMMKWRAGRVEAILEPLTLPRGSKPSVDPLGWDYAAQVAVQKPNKAFKAHRGWVRFHLLNENLGGAGDDERNLVPTLNVYNTGKKWRDFEEAAKLYLITYRLPIAFELSVDFHQDVNSPMPQPGDNQLHNFPKTITAEFQYFDNQKGWTVPRHNGNVRLSIPPPSVTPGNAAIPLTDCSEKTLTGVFGIHSWLAKRLVEMRGLIEDRQPATVQDLYDLLYDFVVLYRGDSKNPTDDLNYLWPQLERQLNKTVGTALRIYPGWNPNNSTAVRRYAISPTDIRVAASSSSTKQLEAYAQHLNINIQALSLFKNIDNPKTTWDLYYQLTFEMRQPYQYTQFDRQWWPQILRALTPSGVHISGITRSGNVQTKTQKDQEKQRQLRQEQERQRILEEQRRQQEEERRVRELERQRQEQEQSRQAQERRRVILTRLSDSLRDAKRNTQFGQILSQNAEHYYRTKADDFINKVWYRVRDKFDDGGYREDVNYLNYYQVNFGLSEILRRAREKYPSNVQPTVNVFQGGWQQGGNSGQSGTDMEFD